MLPLTVLALSKFLKSSEVQWLSYNHCYHHHCLENVGWPSTIPACLCAADVDLWALQEWEGHKQLHRVYTLSELADSLIKVFGVLILTN